MAVDDLRDLRRLETHLAKDKGYGHGRASFSDEQTALGGFVCPRANAYGGREGIIPPGVAAQHGLIPARMRKIAVADTVKSALAAAADGRTEADRYREYYGNGPAESLKREQEARELARTERQPDRSPVPEHGTNTTHTTHTTHTEDRAESDQPSSPSVEHVVEQSRMFSAPKPDTAGDDTLDGFYDSLQGRTPGTGETDLPPRKRSKPAEREARREHAEGTSAEPAVAPSAVPSTAALPLDALVQQITTLQDQLQAVRGENSRLADELEQARTSVRAEPASGEQIRIVLSQPETRIKLGGKDWECRIMGALHASRTGDSAVLTVSDPSYASELLASVVPGPLVCLTENGRTSCVYRGHCAKIYGDTDNADFIAAFRLENVSTEVTAAR